MYADVLDGLSCSSGIMGECEQLVNRASHQHTSKRHALHREWSTQVFDKIQVNLGGG
jgi:hypothetical protein